MSRPVVFRLVGGLGNQLFGLAAAISFSKSHNVEVMLDFTEVQANLVSHGQSIEPFVNGLLKTRRSRFGSTKMHKIMAMAETRFIFLVAKSGRFFFTQDARYPGFDSGLIDPKSRYRLFRGYFQSYKHVVSARAELQLLFRRIQSSSSWHDSNGKLPKRRLGVHLRRGDYRMNPDIGVIDIRSIEGAVRDACSRREYDEIWIFSDEPSVASELGSRLAPLAAKTKSSELSSALDEFVALASCAGHVISNSTFSWWAAMLAESEDVSFPEPWFARMPEPHDLNPTTWSSYPADFASADPINGM